MFCLNLETNIPHKSVATESTSVGNKPTTKTSTIPHFVLIISNAARSRPFKNKMSCRSVRDPGDEVKSNRINRLFDGYSE